MAGMQILESQLKKNLQWTYHAKRFRTKDNLRDDVLGFLPQWFNNDREVFKP